MLDISDLPKGHLAALKRLKRADDADSRIYAGGKPKAVFRELAARGLAAPHHCGECFSITHAGREALASL